MNLKQLDLELSPLAEAVKAARILHAAAYAAKSVNWRGDAEIERAELETRHALQAASKAYRTAYKAFVKEAEALDKEAAEMQREFTALRAEMRGF